MSSSLFKSKRPFVSKAELLSRSVKAPQIGTSRKYPVLIALDDSGSMSGAPFTGALAASIELGQELARPENLDAFQVALMLFEGVARTSVPFTPASSFQVPGGLAATGPGTDFTVALNHAKSILEPVGAPESTPERPTLVFLTDGQHVASSDPAPVAAEVKSIANVVCIAFGAGADLGVPHTPRLLALVRHACDDGQRAARVLRRDRPHALEVASRGRLARGLGGGSLREPEALTMRKLRPRTRSSRTSTTSSRDGAHLPYSRPRPPPPTGGRCGVLPWPRSRSP
ncbi:MAG: VWA domain-containing protein [Sandaracinaceae bacterium]|nr:VWA domain-containing protein [Sandaracinaceae bacterium]